ncbi:glycosyltransferase [Micropruina sp.]|uniref:glycosyltransferase n=1 Tax=Micropruina sp. TaxID=2737536 RepID=UPI0039E46A29
MLPDNAVLVPATADSTGRTSPLTRPRRVGYVTKMFPRFSETFILTELLQVERLGVDVEVFSLRPPTDGRFHAGLADLRAPVSYLRSSGIRAADLWAALAETAAEFGDLGPHLADLLRLDVRDAVQAAELARLVRQRGITHLHAHFASAGAGVARVAAAIAGIGYGFTAHAKDIFHDGVDRDDLARKLRDATDVVTVSEFNLAYLRRTFGPDAAAVRRVYNGLDLAGFPFASPLDRPARIAGVGRLVEKKGFGDLLEAVALLIAEGRDVELVLVGSGEYDAPLRAQAERLGLGSRLRMLGGLPQHRVAEIVAGAAAFAAPCVVGADGNRDGLPTVLLEAMALGTPCVATPVTGIPEVIRDNVTGLLVPEHDPAALAVALGRLLDEPQLRVRLAGAARGLIEREFDARRQAQLVADGFSAAAANGHGRASGHAEGSSR